MIRLGKNIIVDHDNKPFINIVIDNFGSLEIGNIVHLIRCIMGTGLIFAGRTKSLNPSLTICPRSNIDRIIFSIQLIPLSYELLHANRVDISDC
ncbi:hypothetical protein D3C73_377990 [compost metagenome]